MFSFGICRVVLVAGALVAASGAQAGVVLDQSNQAIFGNSFFGSRLGFAISDTRFGYVQSFTAGRTGYLDHLDFDMIDAGVTGKVTFSLYSGDFASSDATLLLTSTLDTSQIADNLASAIIPSRFDVRSADFLVAAGTRYSVTFDYAPTSGTPFILLAHSYFGPSPYGSQIHIGSDYTGGGLNLQTTKQVGHVGTAIDGDVGFRSYVEELGAPNPAAVPEPASWAMMLGGFAVLGGAMRRQKVGIRFA